MSLANTTWTLNDGSGTSTTLIFGSNQGSAASPYGSGTATTNYAPPTGPISNDILWSEDGAGNFMYQIKGPTDTGNISLPTVSGSYGASKGRGWGTNFIAGSWDMTMAK